MIAYGDLLRAFLLTLSTLLALGCEFRIPIQYAAQDYIVVEFGNFWGIKHAGGIVHLKAFGDADAGGAGHAIPAASTGNLDSFPVFGLDLIKEIEFRLRERVRKSLFSINNVLHNLLAVRHTGQDHCSLGMVPDPL